MTRILTSPSPLQKIMALVIRAPWAFQIAEGTKLSEFRTWSSRYRGPLLIVAAKRRESGKYAGCGICIVDLTDITQRGLRDFAWHLDNVRVLRRPLPIAGRLGLFDVTDRLPRDLVRDIISKARP
jgi:hypothetical protein